MFSITNFREGAVLNRHHGVESADALLIDLEGICQYGSPVRVNGILAESDGTRFSVRLPLTEKGGQRVSTIFLADQGASPNTLSSMREAVGS